MYHMEITRHAATRAQQRGIPTIVIDSLWQFSSTAHDHHGAEILYFDKPAKRHLEKALSHSSFVKLEPHLDAYAVVANDGLVLTVGHRTRKINRN